MNNAVKFASLVAGTFLILLVLRVTQWLAFDARQIASILIFSMFIFGTLLYAEFRLAFAFGGIALLMASNLLSVERFTQAANLDVIIFLVGTFLVIGYLEDNQFFEHVVSAIVGMIGPKPQLLLLTLMLMGSVFSALVGEVTAILFMSGALLHLTSNYKLNPIPFIIMLVFACNNGSAMSSVGNPIGVLIALKTGLSFVDFLKWAAPVAIVVDVATFIICRWWFAREFAAFSEAVMREFEFKNRTQVRELALAGGGNEDGPAVAIASESASVNPLSETYFSSNPVSPSIDQEARRTYWICWAILLGLILLLVTHGQSEHALGNIFHIPRISAEGRVEINPDGSTIYGLKEGTMMVASALIMGCIVLMLCRERAREMVERRVDWWTLSFFMMLFASVGTLQDTQVTNVIAQKLSHGGGGPVMTTQIVGWATGWLSAFLDNVLAVATFMPVVHDIRANAAGPYSSAIYWFMLFGGTFMGNMTIIGSTANIVAVGLLEKRGHGTIGFGYWMKIGAIVAIVSMLIATFMLLAMNHLGMPMLANPRMTPSA